MYREKVFYLVRGRGSVEFFGSYKEFLKFRVKSILMSEERVL